jgi:chromosomal replication initiator protein
MAGRVQKVETMTTGVYAGTTSDAPGGAVWTQACMVLRRELGEATFGSYLGQASLRETPASACVVAATGVARDWIRRHAWRRICELWSSYDPLARPLDLKSRMEYDAANAAEEPREAPPVAVAVVEAVVEPEPAQAGLAARSARQQGLQERFSFDTFVAGPANEFAFAVARRVASWSDGHFNPVLFHGPYGFGKTHLLNAIAWEAMRQAPDKRVVYLTAERFTSTFVRAVQDRQTAAFKAELRNADLLLIDDVHFVAGKPSTQEELFHTLIALVEDGRRVVMTADRTPTELSEMEPRLRSHLQSGLVCGVEPADRTLRLGILERKLATLAQQGRFMPAARPEVLQFLADRFTDSVRELEGRGRGPPEAGGSPGDPAASPVLRREARDGRPDPEVRGRPLWPAAGRPVVGAQGPCGRPPAAGGHVDRQADHHPLPARHRPQVRRPRPHDGAARRAPHRGPQGRRRNPGAGPGRTAAQAAGLISGRAPQRGSGLAVRTRSDFWI